MKFITIIFMLFFSAFLFGQAPLDVGDPAPAMTVTDQDGQEVDLATAYAEGPALVYFYPKADTPGCTKQACNLRDHFSELREAGIQVFGVSTDSVQNQDNFHEKYNLPFTLIADKDKVLGKAFGVSTYAGTVFKRQTFLIVDGKIAWKDLNASPDSQASDALEAYSRTKSDS